MALKKFIIVIFSFFLTAGFFSWIGRRFLISWLLFDYQYTDKGVFFSIGPLVPIMIGFIVSIFVEKIYIKRSQQKQG
jgi:hypothetical protein